MHLLGTRVNKGKGKRSRWARMPPSFLRDRLLVRSDAVTPQRRELLRTVAGRVLELPRDRVTRVGIDGVDGAGKTTFADELALTLEGLGRRAIRASIDGFHSPRVGSGARDRLGGRLGRSWRLQGGDTFEGR